MMNQFDLVSLGMMIILAGVIVIAIGTLLNSASEKSEVKFSVFGLVGPIPFGFGNDKTVFISTAVFFLMVLLFFYLRMR